MAERSLVKIVSEKCIKPSSPTPSSSRYYKLCAFDTYIADFPTEMAFFYPKGTLHGRNSSRTELFELLEASLSKTLTYYYPFAGRFINDNITIDCNDAGVHVWEVQIQASMSEILNDPKGHDSWNKVFIRDIYNCVSSLVTFQLIYFECGGICVVFSLSHRLGDGRTVANFMNDWSMVALGSQSIPPVLSGSSIFPPPTDPIKNGYMPERRSDIVTKRFVFSVSNISKLKQKVAKQTGIKNPTQVEVVTALIFKSIMSAATKINSSFKPSAMMQTANFRPLIIPPLSEQLVGNFINKFTTFVTEEESDFSRIVTEMRKSKNEYFDAHKARIEENEFKDRLSKFCEEDEKKLNGNDFDIYKCISFFRFPLYEVDFGFGKPLFVCMPGGSSEQSTVLTGTPNGDGITAFVGLKEDQMSIFELDEELLAFASLNPIVYVEN